MTKKITELIGFKAEQFRQIVLLPQGEFRRFLIAESKDRKAILETIFKTELYRRIEALLAERSTAIDNDYKALKQQQQFILNSTECENNDQLLADIQIFLQRQKEETAALQTASAQLAAAKLQLQQAQELHNAFAEATAARTAFLTLTEQRSAVETAKTEAAQADKAALLEEIYNSTCAHINTTRNVCQPNKALSRQQQRRKQSCRNCTKSFQNNYNSLTVKVSRILRTWIKRWSF